MNKAGAKYTSEGRGVRPRRIIFDIPGTILLVVLGISILMNLYFTWKSVRHECVLRETTSD